MRTIKQAISETYRVHVGNTINVEKEKEKLLYDDRSKKSFENFKRPPYYLIRKTMDETNMSYKETVDYLIKKRENKL